MGAIQQLLAAKKTGGLGPELAPALVDGNYTLVDAGDAVNNTLVTSGGIMTYNSNTTSARIEVLSILTVDDEYEIATTYSSNTGTFRTLAGPGSTTIVDGTSPTIVRFTADSTRFDLLNNNSVASEVVITALSIKKVL